ncbi:GrpB family protein [Oceanobacillus oncorhynchi]|uniref:GrpB family protein n=1 Tax=Oceanobacillus oncorhynchi TaxID=545501 RepID=UPI00279600B1|nr:GrpB family protein [Oceanobacillus oncorhynchi]
MHFYEIGDSEIERHLVFRNYLRSHLDAVKEYGKFLKKLSQRFPNDIEAYISGKERLVSMIEKKTMAWYQDLSKH